MSNGWKLTRAFQSSFGRIAYDVFGGGPPLVLIRNRSRHHSMFTIMCRFRHIMVS